VNLGETQFLQIASFGAVLFQQEAFFDKTQFHYLTDFSYAEFRRDADFSYTEFYHVRFSPTQFYQDVDFSYAKFCQDAVFRAAEFYQDAYFRRSEFHQDASFSHTQFHQLSDFSLAKFDNPAPFTGVRYWPNTFAQYLLTRKVTEFYLDDQNIDAVTNPRFKRYVADQQFIRVFRIAHPILAGVWRWSSDYGRSFGMWAFWSVLLAFLFALAYTPADTPIPFLGRTMPDWWQGFWLRHGAKFEQTAESYGNEPLSFGSAFYFSIVTFTTLGFGDVITANTLARFLVTIEVIWGYIMLGGLISIFANKLARRS
jgi:uncharacterized protein YjbI with pentapeptide repeats